MEIHYGTQALTDFLAARHAITMGAHRADPNAHQMRVQSLTPNGIAALDDDKSALEGDLRIAETSVSIGRA